MSRFLIRNDDVAFDTSLQELKTFCEICDKHKYKIIQAITPLGECRKANSKMSNEDIEKSSTRRFEENKELVKYLLSREDLIAVHGLWHTHAPSVEDIQIAKSILENLGFRPTYFVPPFNEGQYPETVAGLRLCQLSLQNGERLEDFLKKATPSSPIMYLHSWRFNNDWYSFDDLDKCLARLANNQRIKKTSDMPADPARLWYNEWVTINARGSVLDIGKSKHWDYGFPTFDSNTKLNPTYIGNIEKTVFDDNSFDTVLCNGMYELVDNPQAMIDEVVRITKKGGLIIFGFVGRDYKPYLNPWKYFDWKEKLPAHTRADFEKVYHFIIIEKQ